MSLRDNPIVQYILEVQGGTNLIPLKKLASPQLTRLLEVDDTEQRAWVPGPSLPVIEEDEEEEEPATAASAAVPGANEFVSDDEEPDAISAASMFAPSDDDFMAYGAAPAAAAAPARREVRAGPPMPAAEVARAQQESADAAVAGLNTTQVAVLREREQREANMINQIINVVKQGVEGTGVAITSLRLMQPGQVKATAVDRATLTDVFTGGYIIAQKAALQKVHSFVHGPVRKVRSIFDFILANDDDVRSLWKQLVVRELTRAENLNPGTLRLTKNYEQNEQHLFGILEQFDNYDFYVDGDNMPIFTPFERQDVWDTTRERDNRHTRRVGYGQQYRGPIYNS